MPKKEPDRWFRIVSPGYVAALCVNGETARVTQAAPILRRFVGLEWLKVREQFRLRNFEVDELEGNEELTLSGGKHD